MQVWLLFLTKNISNSNVQYFHMINTCTPNGTLAVYTWKALKCVTGKLPVSEAHSCELMTAKTP